MVELAVLLLVNQVGNGNVAVVSPPGPYDNMAGGSQQCTEAPPEYSEVFGGGGFSDAVIRRGEGSRENQDLRETNIFLRTWSELHYGKECLLPNLLCSGFEIDLKFKIVSCTLLCLSS